MAGNPKRRARREAFEQATGGAAGRPGMELPPQPAEGASAAEMRAYAEEVRRILRAELRELRRPVREAALRAGKVSPRNQAEIAMFGADRVARETTGDDGSPATGRT